MSGLRMVYLALVAWGTVHPLANIWSWIEEFGFTVPGIMQALQVNAATTAMFWDLLIAATALTVWIIAETRVTRNWSALWSIPATFFIGVSCGLPLYLFLRTRIPKP